MRMADASGKGENPGRQRRAGGRSNWDEKSGKGIDKKNYPDLSYDVYENKLNIDTLSDKVPDIVPDFAGFKRHPCLTER